MKKTLLIALLCMSGLAQAKDYGVLGNVWPITEIDVRQLLLESASRTDWTETNRQATESAKNYLSNLQKRTLPQIDRTATAYFDPSIVLTSDIQAPVKQPDGSFQWQILASKGQKVNPLDKYRPVTAFFLFDGSQEDQVQLLREVMAAEPDRIVPVEAGNGDVKTTSDAFKRAIFYANDSFLSRFQVKYLPSLVFPGVGANASFIGVTAFGQPYKAPEVLNAWGAIAPGHQSKATPGSTQ